MALNILLYAHEVIIDCHPEAVTIRRELAAANPDRYRPDLAASLDNLGVMFSELGRPADAEAAQREAQAIQTSGK
jgi:hypothetical protein